MQDLVFLGGHKPGGLKLHGSPGTSFLRGARGHHPRLGAPGLREVSAGGGSWGRGHPKLLLLGC